MEKIKIKSIIKTVEKHLFPLLNSEGKIVERVKLVDYFSSIFLEKFFNFKDSYYRLIHKVVVIQNASIRSSFPRTLTRGDSSYSNKKIRPQKGTGRARQGSYGAPHHFKGYKAHGPKGNIKNYLRKVNKKEYFLSLLLLILKKIDKLFILKEDMTSIRTKNFIKNFILVHNLQMCSSVLLLFKNKKKYSKLLLSSRNCSFLIIKNFYSFLFKDLIKSSGIFLTLEVLEEIGKIGKKYF